MYGATMLSSKALPVQGQEEPTQADKSKGCMQGEQPPDLIHRDHGVCVGCGTGQLPHALLHQRIGEAWLIEQIACTGDCKKLRAQR